MGLPWLGLGLQEAVVVHEMTGVGIRSISPGMLSGGAVMAQVLGGHKMLHAREA